MIAPSGGVVVVTGEASGIGAPAARSRPVTGWPTAGACSPPLPDRHPTAPTAALLTHLVAAGRDLAWRAETRVPRLAVRGRR